MRAGIDAFIQKTDRAIIRLGGKIHAPFSRIALFVLFFWFGILKLFALSPAGPLVEGLLSRLAPGVAPASFVVAFGVFEMLIGILFVIPRLERLAIGLMAPHLFLTILPLFVLPEAVWQAPLVPTLEGQYIIKNIVIIALAMVVTSHLKPIHPDDDPGGESGALADL